MRLVSRIGSSGLALMSLVLAYAWLLQGGTDNERSHYALVSALARGTAAIDAIRFQLGDWATVDIIRWEGQTYSNKPPGLALLTVGPFLALRSLGLRDTGDPTTMLWALGLFGVVLPAAVLFLLVRRVADRVELGMGTPVAVTIGVATLVLPFATTFHSHVLGACLVFATFTVLFLERDAPSRPWLVASAGLLAGLAVTTDYPNTIAAVAFGIYAITRAPRLRRAFAYGAGFVVGIAPVLLYQWWVFGSILRVTYAGERLGSGAPAEVAGYANPEFRLLAESLFSMSGLLITAPVLVCGFLGIGLMYRRGLCAESLVIGVIVALVLIYNASYKTEFDSYSGGERYLISIVALLAIPLAQSFRRFPTTTTALGMISGVLMIALTSSHVRHGRDPNWFREIGDLRFPQTVLSFVGITGWYAVLPFFAATAAAVAAAIAASGPVRVSLRETAFGFCAVLGWAIAAVTAPNLYEGRSSLSDYWSVVLVGAALAAAAAGARLAHKHLPLAQLRPDRARG